MEQLKKINLFIPGAAKSGTSSFHTLLNVHPKINMSASKEPHFLSRTRFSNRINTTDFKEELSVYLSNFDFTKEYSFRGESSTGYFYFPFFKENIKSYGSNDTKFIFILRNPIDRTYSHYCYLKSLGSEEKPFREAVLENHLKDPGPEDLLPELIVKNYYQYSLYGKWMEKFLKQFKSQQIKVILFEDLKQNPKATLNDCFLFLGLEPIDEIPTIESNKTVKILFPKFYKKLRIFAFNKSKSRDVIKHFLPKKFRRKYKKAFTEFFLHLTKTRKTFPKLTAEERSWLHELFKDDVELLKKQTKMNFEPWQDFND